MECSSNGILRLLIDSRPPELFSLGFGSSETRPDALLDHCTLKFGEDAHHLEHGFAGRRRGVELTNAERQARWRGKRNALARKAVLDKARKPWDLQEASKGDAIGYAYEVGDWWTAYEYRVRKELELCPTTFSDQDDRAAVVRALEEVGEGIRQLAQKVRAARARVT